MVREEGWWGDLQLYLVSMGDFFNINAPLALTYKSLLRNSYFRRRVRKSDLRESLKLLYDEDKKRGCLFDLLYKTLGGRNLIPANKKEVGIIKSLMEKVSSYKSKILEKRKFSDIDFLRGIDIFSQVLSYFNARSGLNIFRTNVFCLSPLEHKRRNILLSSVRRYLPDLKKFSENWNKRCEISNSEVLRIIYFVIADSHDNSVLYDTLRFRDPEILIMETPERGIYRGIIRDFNLNDLKKIKRKLERRGYSEVCIPRIVMYRANKEEFRDYVEKLYALTHPSYIR